MHGAYPCYSADESVPVSSERARPSGVARNDGPTNQLYFRVLLK